MPKWLLPLLCLPCIAADATPAETWTRFRGPNGSGISNETGFPVEFNKTKNVLWRSPVRPGKSSPVLTRRHIFLTASDQGKLYTQCFDRKTGKMVWERFIERPRTEIANRLNHEAAITPVTDGVSVYSFFKDFGLVSYDSAGNVRWTAPLGPFINTQGLGASPIIVGDSVILVADQWENSYIAAFSRASGEMQWKTAREEAESWGSPLLYEMPKAAAEIVTISRGRFGLHAAANGRRTATLTGVATVIVGSPVIVNDTVYAFGYGNDEPQPFAPRLQKLDANKDGKLSRDEYGEDPIMNNIGNNAGNRDTVVTEDEWKIFADRVLGPNKLFAVRIENGSARELWRHEKNYTSVIPSTLAYKDVLYLVRNGGILTTHDAMSGNVIKNARIEGALGGYSSSPVAAEGKIWIASEEGKVAVLRAAGDWEVLQVNDLREGCYATPALSGGVIYLRTEEALYAFASKP